MLLFFGMFLVNKYHYNKEYINVDNKTAINPQPFVIFRCIFYPSYNDPTQPHPKWQGSGGTHQQMTLFQDNLG